MNNGKWIEFNDSYVTVDERMPEMLKSQEAYLLVYRQRLETAAPKECMSSSNNLSQSVDGPNLYFCCSKLSKEDQSSEMDVDED